MECCFNCINAEFKTNTDKCFCSLDNARIKYPLAKICFDYEPQNGKVKVKNNKNFIHPLTKISLVFVMIILGYALYEYLPF
jgi:hypothetical protein